LVNRQQRHPLSQKLQEIETNYILVIFVLPPSLSQRRKLTAFSLVELLVVISIIAILSALTIGTAGYMLTEAGKKRAKGEIASMESALERYKIDNGAYPVAANTLGANGYSGTPLLTSASILLTNLWQYSPGKYMEFNRNMIATNGSTPYARDPFGNNYGFASGANAFFNTNFVDLWSTAKTTNQLQWVGNWPQP
jgi:prepilin-type N-terminal cleavage/methylation domain-containing protein